MGITGQLHCPFMREYGLSFHFKHGVIHVLSKMHRWD